MLPIPDQLYLAYERTFHPDLSATRLAEHVGVSRTTVYNVVERVVETLQPQKRGPKPADRTAALHAEIHFLYEYIASLEADLAQSVRLTEQRTEDFVLTASVLGVSLRKIGDLFQVAFDRPLSKDRAQALLNRYQPVARQIFEELRPLFHERVSDLCADEIFLGQAPVLVGVEPQSMAWVLLKRAAHRDAETWNRELAPFAHLEVIASDRGKGLGAAIEAQRAARAETGEPLHHQHDHFHFKHDRGKVLRHLEAAAYRAMEREEAQRQAVAQVQDRRGHATTLAKLRAKTEAALERFDAAEQGCQQIDEALTLFDPQGELKRPEHAHQMLGEAVGPLEALGETCLKPVIRQAKDPKLLTFLTVLWSRLAALAIPQSLLGLLTFLWFYGNQASEATRQRLAGKALTAWLVLQAERKAGAPVGYWYHQVDLLLAGVLRASSLIEAMNSLVRGYQNNKKHLSEDFLFLCALYHNLHPFRTGKRKGRSPLEMLGIAVPCQNWLHLLRHPELVKQIGTSKR